MKNFNLLSKMCSPLVGSQSNDVSFDCRLTVGSPSGLDAKWKQNPFMRFAVVLTLIFTIGIGNVCGAEQTAYTLSGTTTGGTSGYAEVSNITQSSKDWKVLGNTGISPWRIGGAKNTSGTNTNRYIYSQTAITENITKVVVTHGSMFSMTVNSVTLNVYSTAAKAVTGGTGDISSVSVTYVDDGNMTFNRPAGHNWAGRFFRIDYDLTWTSSNKAKYILFSSAVFKYDDAPACSAPAAPTISGTAAYTADQTITLTASCVSGADASTTYTWYKGADWATARAASPVQATSTSGATFTKASCVVGDAGKYWCEASNGSGCEAHNSTGYDVTVSAGSIAVTGVSVDPTSKTIFVGETFDITPTVAPANATNKNVSWSSSATSYATVISGTVTGVAAGSSTITCTTTDGSYTATCEVTVRGVTLQARDEDGNAIGVGGPGAPTRSGTTITAAANAGNYVFKQWQVTNASVASTTTTPTTISDPTGAVTVTAVYYKPVTITYKANGATFTTQTYARGGTLAFPASGPNGDTYSCTGKTFVGWVGEANKDYSHASIAPAYVTAGSSVTEAATYYAVFADASGGGSTTKTDEFTYTSFFSACTPTGANVNGAYTDFSSISGSESDAVYAGNLMEHGDGPANCHDYIQMRSKNSHSGIITTTSGGTAKKVTVEWNSAQAADKVLNIYGKSTAYSAASDLYNDATDGDLLGTITSGTSTEYSITGDYEHIGIRSADGSLLFDEISIDWQVGGGYTYSNYATTCCTPLGSVTGNIGTNTPTSVTLTWSDVSGAEKYQVKVPGSSSHNDWTDAVSGVSVTKSCGTAYTAYFRAIDTNSSHCSEGPESTLAIPAVSWTVTSTGVTNATASPAIPSTTCSGFSTTISPATGYALPADITVTNASKSWNSSTGALSISSVTGNVSITITPTCVSPVIGTDPADADYYVGDSPDALSVSATLASGTLTYLWKVSTNGGSTWSDATGTNNTASYSGASLSTASAGTLKFKCIVGNSEGGCTVESAVATITVSNASYFPNGKTIFIQAESSSAWSDANYDCVKAWFHTAGGSETAQTTYWLFDATGGDSGKKLFAAIVPATGDLPYLDIQRFTHDCSDWRNKNGGCSYSDANGSNTIRSTGNTDTYDAQDDYIRWNATGVTMNLMSSDAWLTPVASMTDQGSGVWSGTYEYTPSNTSTEYVIATNYNGNIGNTGSNSNATLSGMVVGSTYDVTATLDIKEHSLEMSKTFVKGTVHFNLQGHGLAISDLTNVTAGSKISAPSPAPSATGWTFGGWYKEPACTNAWDFANDVVKETMTLYAKWTPHNFTITYEGLAGASNTNPTSYTIETATIVLANPGSRTGYTFTGWTLGGSPITQIVLGTTGDKTITATWSINTPNLAVSAADHVVITATPASESAIAEGANRNVNYNKTVTLNCTPDEHWNLVWDVYKTGESSTKVALSGSGDGATFTMPDYGVTVSAVMTEAAYKTVCFKNNGEDIDGYASVKVYVGESPVAPTLTDGTSGDACDPTSDKHYGWTKETWTSTIATQSEIDARTGTEAVYAKSAALPVVAAEDPATITYHAVWAAGSGSPAINSTLIAKWDKQALTASTAVKAKDKDGNTLNDVTMTSSFNLATEGTYCYQNTITSTVTITISGLDFSAYDKGALSFYARGSQTRTIDVDYSTGGAYSDLVTTPKITKKEQAYEISNIPKATTSIKLTYVYGTSGETFYFGTVRAYGVNNTPSYEFTELTDDNTSGWTGSDWDGYYIITGNSSTKALRSSGICGFSDFATVSAVDSKISTSDIGLIFRINYSSENSGFVVQGLGGGDYMATEKVNSDAFSIMTTTVAYLYGMSYNSLAHTSSTYLKWSTDRFGIYSSSTGVNPTLYKMLGAAENFLTTCCTQYDISGASTSGTAVTGGTLTSTDNSACEDREVKITANVSDGYRFDSWTITAGGSPVARKDGSAEIEDGNPIYVFDMPAADVTVSATFTRVYTVTYDANGGTGEMIDVNSPYAAGDKVTVLTNTFTKAGYNFDSWSYSPAVSVTDGKFDMPSSDVTITAQWTAKPLNNIILAQTEAEIYDQQYVQIDVTYDPADIVTKDYTLTGPALTKVVTTGSTKTQLKISATKAGVVISEVVSETVSIKAKADETKTASVVVTIKPLPRVHFTDIIHNVVFGDVVEEIVGNVLSGAKTTPTHSDISDPGASYNTCERQHLHLLGWIESTWADAHPGATSGEITGAGSSIYYEAGASINVEVQNGKTFYAVWCIVE